MKACEQKWTMLWILIALSILSWSECSETQCKVHYSLIRSTYKMTYDDARKLCKTVPGGHIAMLKNKPLIYSLRNLPELEKYTVLIGARLDPDSGESLNYFWNDGEAVNKHIFSGTSSTPDPSKACISLATSMSRERIENFTVTGLLPINCVGGNAVLCQWCGGDVPGPTPGIQADCKCLDGFVTEKSSKFCKYNCFRGVPGYCQRMVECPLEQCKRMKSLTSGCDNKRCYCASYEDCFRREGTGFCMHGCVRDRFRDGCLTDACEVGRYGDNCEMKCDCQDGLGCAKDTGLCNKLIRCEGDWYGEGCDVTLCPPGTWGANCEETCRCEYGEPCDARTGQCPGKCEDGWVGNCSVPFCPVGKFGPTCTGHCECNGTTCSLWVGICPIRRRRHDCKEQNTWGLLCNETCSLEHCAMCERHSGKLCKQCEAGYQLNVQKTCQKIVVVRKVRKAMNTSTCEVSGKWGPDCEQACLNSKCKSCDKETGTKCLDTGWHDEVKVKDVLLCREEFRWGENCDKDCLVPHCHVCDQLTGNNCLSRKDAPIDTAHKIIDGSPWLGVQEGGTPSVLVPEDEDMTDHTTKAADNDDDQHNGLDAYVPDVPTNVLLNVVYVLFALSGLVCLCIVAVLIIRYRRKDTVAEPPLKAPVTAESGSELQVTFASDPNSQEKSLSLSIISEETQSFGGSSIDTETD